MVDVSTHIQLFAMLCIFLESGVDRTRNCVGEEEGDLMGEGVSSFSLGIQLKQYSRIMMLITKIKALGK